MNDRRRSSRRIHYFFHSGANPAAFALFLHADRAGHAHPLHVIERDFLLVPRPVIDGEIEEPLHEVLLPLARRFAKILLPLPFRFTEVLLTLVCLLAQLFSRFRSFLAWSFDCASIDASRLSMTSMTLPAGRERNAADSGGALASTDTTAPYEWSWNTATASNGSHSLASKAYDAANNIGSSSTVGVTVSNDTTAPANGATVSGTTNVTASATDNVGAAL